MSVKKLSIFTVKQIIDIVCDELENEERELPKLVIQLEEKLHKKEQEIHVLYKENSQLEQRIKELEQELDILLKVATCTKVENDTTDLPKENEKEHKEVNAEETKNVVLSEEDTKQKRREYLREYKRNYRKRQREKKLEFTM